jgi:DNA repair exonuclease SbcCD ATPase subunit
MQKSATEKASRVVNITMSSAVSNGANRHVTAKILAHASATKDEVLLSLVGPDGLEKMKQNKLAHDDVRQKLKSVEDRTSPEYQALNINLHTFQAERTAVQEKMEELKNALKRLEEEDTMINRKIIETQKEISSLDETCNGEVAMLKKELAQASKTAESDNSIRARANQLAVYESSVKNSVNVSSAVSTGNENIAEIIPNKIGLYLTRARNYFRSEADCVQFLRNRVRTLEKEIISLVSRKMLNASLLLVTQYLPVSISLLLTEEPTRGVYIPGIDYQRTPSFTFN